MHVVANGVITFLLISISDNHLTHDNIIGTNVPIHYYHDVLVEDNNVIVCNDQNDAFCGTFIYVYNLEVLNLKGHIYS